MFLCLVRGMEEILRKFKSLFPFVERRLSEYIFSTFVILRVNKLRIEFVFFLLSKSSNYLHTQGE